MKTAFKPRTHKTEKKKWKWRFSMLILQKILEKSEKKKRETEEKGKKEKMGAITPKPK